MSISKLKLGLNGNFVPKIIMPLPHKGGGIIKRGPAPWLSKVKGQGRKVIWSVWQLLAHKSRTKQETPKLVERLPTPHKIMCTSFKVKGQRSMSPGLLMLRPKVHHILRMRRPTNFNLCVQMEHEDPYHRQAPWPPRSKGQGRDVTWCVWQVLSRVGRTQRTHNLLLLTGYFV